MKAKGLDVRIGVIPMGTANDFAGALGMAHDPLTAARQIAAGRVERVDCGLANGRYFVNVFSFGIFTTTSQHTPDTRKHRVGKMAYLIEGAARAAFDTRRAAADRGRRRPLHLQCAPRR